MTFPRAQTALRNIGPIARAVDLRALIHAAEHGGSLCCVAAGRMLGLWILEHSDDLHLWFGHAGNPRPCARHECKPHPHWDHGKSALGELPPVRNVLRSGSPAPTPTADSNR